MESRHTTRSADRTNPTFQCRYPFLEHCHSRIGYPAVDVSRLFEVKEPRRLVSVCKAVRSGLIDRHASRAGRWVRFLTCVKGKRVKFQIIGFNHELILTAYLLMLRRLSSILNETSPTLVAWRSIRYALPPVEPESLR